MKLYMCVTADDLEMPLAIADSAAELGSLIGMKREAILEYIAKAKNPKSRLKGNRLGYKLLRIEVDDE